MQRFPQKRRRPFTVINFVRLPFRCSRDLCFRLGDCVLIQVFWNDPAPAFQCTSTIASVCDEMFQRAEKKRPKPAFLSIGMCVSAALDQMSKETLGQVLRIVRPISLLAQESVERPPINLASL